MAVLVIFIFLSYLSLRSKGQMWDRTIPTLESDSLLVISSRLQIYVSLGQSYGAISQRWMQRQKDVKYLLGIPSKRLFGCPRWAEMSRCRVSGCLGTTAVLRLLQGGGRCLLLDPREGWGRLDLHTEWTKVGKAGEDGSPNSQKVFFFLETAYQLLWSTW